MLPAFQAIAVPPDQSVQYDFNVVFDGKSHAGFTCDDCHPKIFPMSKRDTPILMIEIEAGMLCGECHNGKKAFGVKTTNDCMKCHKGF